MLFAHPARLLKQLDLVAALRGGRYSYAVIRKRFAVKYYLRNSYIPTYTEIGPRPSLLNWPLDPTQVATNGRGQARIFLIDPAFQIGANAARHGVLPYAPKSEWISSALPTSPRLMILSSMFNAVALTNVISGIPAVTNDFSVIWNTADGNTPRHCVFHSLEREQRSQDSTDQSLAAICATGSQRHLSPFRDQRPLYHQSQPCALGTKLPAPTNHGVTAYSYPKLRFCNHQPY